MEFTRTEINMILNALSNQISNTRAQARRLEEGIELRIANPHMDTPDAIADIQRRLAVKYNKLYDLEELFEKVGECLEY